jgi:hypothetical protein
MSDNGHFDISEALSVSALTNLFGDKITLLLEKQICSSFNKQNLSKPDCIIRLGMIVFLVSITRAFNFFGKYTQTQADKLIEKKVSGLQRVMYYSLFYAKQSYTGDTSNLKVRPILHVITPTNDTARMVLRAFRNLKTEIIMVISVNDSKLIYQ